MSDQNQHDAEQYQAGEELVPISAPDEHLALRDLAGVALSITAHLGNCSLSVREVLDLRRGSVLPLDKHAGEMADIAVNGIPLAKGEVVVLGDSLHVRIAEIHGLQEQDRESEENA